MTYAELWRRSERMIFGFLMGVAATVLATLLWHQARGYLHLSGWRRAVEAQNLERLAGLLEEEVTLAQTAFADGEPLPVSEYLAFEFMPRLYRHHMRYMVLLLERGEVERFNQLRTATGFVLLDLSGEDLSGLSFAGSDFSGADLEGADLSGSDLSGCSFVGAEMSRAILSGARVDQARFDAATLAGATLTAIEGRDASFTEAVLAAATLSQVSGLENARFDGATLDDANLFDAQLPGAVLDGATMQLVSAVDTDLSDIASMAGVDLTGANLAGARLAPERMARAWLAGAEGLDAVTVVELRRHGAIVRPEEVLDRVDSRIVDGYRAQVASDPRIAPDAGARRRVLMSWLKEYYLR